MLDRRSSFGCVGSVMCVYEGYRGSCLVLLDSALVAFRHVGVPPLQMPRKAALPTRHSSRYGSFTNNDELTSTLIRHR